MPKQSIPALVLTFTASGAVAEKRAIGFNGAQATTQGQKVIGVSPRPADDGGLSDVDVAGTTVIETGGAFAVGASLIVDNQGRAIASAGKLALAAGATAVTSSAANGNTIFTGGDTPEFIFADALELSSGAGKFVEVFLRR
ncbi:capsid cement protein [Ensifer soli]|uniref:capsid cement protein n=1 Tax=Ciceribacter sp. sgz301302 TaxID=3342379 RepID=UPI0035BA0D12